MADRTIVLAQNKRHSLRGLTQVNPQEFSAYQETEDDLTYTVDMASYLDGDTILTVTRLPSGITISSPTNTTTRFSQRLNGFGHVDFRVQTNGGDIEEFRIYIQPRAGSNIYAGSSAGGGTQFIDGDKGDITVTGGDTWTIDANAVTNAKIADGAVTSAKILDGTIVDADVNASAGIAYSKLASMTGGSVLLGNASNVPTVTALSGDVTVSNTGVTAIGAGVIVNTDVSSTFADAISATKLSFTQAGTGADARTVDARLKDWVSVKDFGALGNDAANDTTAIQEAIDAVSAAGGGVVWFPPGIYRVASTISVKDNVTLDGGDRQATILATSTGFNNTDFRASARYATNAVIIDMSGLTGSPFTARLRPGVRGLKIKHQSSSGKSLNGIVCRNATFPVIENCEISDLSVGCGIRAASLGGGRIVSNYIYNLTESDALSAWIEKFSGTGSQTVFTLSNPNSYSIALIRVNGIATSAYTYNAGSKQVTFSVAPAAGTSNISVMFNSMQITAIEIDNDLINAISSSELIVDGNRISNIKFTGSAATNWLNETDGINVCGGSRCVFSNNTIFSVGEGFDVFASFNSFVGNSVWSADNFGMKFTHGASHNSIAGLTLTIVGLAGVVVAGSDITGACEGNVFSAITVRNIDASNINSGKNTAGIQLTSGTYAAQNNLFSDVFVDAGSYGEFGVYDTTAGGNNYVTGLRAVGSLGGFAARIDNGLTYSAADQISLHTNATERLRVTNQGVGIGNTAAEAGTVLTANGVASFGDGTAASPSVAHKGDLDTGIYFPSGGNVVGIATNGANRVYIDTNGLGINTTSFSTDKLRVQGGASVRYFGVNTDGKAEQRWNDNVVINDGFTIANNGVSASNQGIGLRFNLDTANGTGNESAYIRALSADTYAAAGNRSASLAIGTINANTLAERMRIDNAGNVGVNITAPEARFHSVNTSAGAATVAAFLQNRDATTSTEVRLAMSATSNTLAQDRHSWIGLVNTGSSNAHAMTFAVNASGSAAAERLRIDGTGNVIINTAAIATSATNGFLYVPTCAGTPTGTPTTYTGRAPIVVDTTNNKLYFYSGGAWRDAGP